MDTVHVSTGIVRHNGVEVEVPFGGTVTLTQADDHSPRIDLIIGRKIDRFPDFGLEDVRVVTGVADAHPADPEIPEGFEIVRRIERPAAGMKKPAG